MQPTSTQRSRENAAITNTATCGVVGHLHSGLLQVLPVQSRGGYLTTHAATTARPSAAQILHAVRRWRKQEGGDGNTAGDAVCSAGRDERKQKNQEGIVSAPGDADVQPDAMVIEVTNASVAYTTVL